VSVSDVGTQRALEACLLQVVLWRLRFEQW
jgi:hypothetical protein